MSALITKHSISKTSGWVSKWLSIFFLNETGILPYTDKTALQQFSVIIKDADQRRKLRSSFECSPELYQIVNHIEDTFKSI